MSVRYLAPLNLIFLQAVVALHEALIKLLSRATTLKMRPPDA